MFVMKKKGTNKYIKRYTGTSNECFTTNINDAETWGSVKDLPHKNQHVTSEYDPTVHRWVSYIAEDMDVVEVEIKEKRVFTNLRKG